MTNNLWIARKKVGYPQKWVASLLGHRSLSVVSEYERGRKLPNLQTALKLEAIYNAPISRLFPRLYAKAERQVVTAKSKYPAIRRLEARASEELGRGGMAQVIPTGCA